MLTALHVAADNSYYDVMDALLRHGAKVNSLDSLGQTGEFSFTFNIMLADKACIFTIIETSTNCTLAPYFIGIICFFLCLQIPSHFDLRR